METLKVNKRFNTREEMEKYEEEVCKEYIVMIINHTPQTIGEDEIYGIDEIWHFGKR